jgi:hypothetical protein
VLPFPEPAEPGPLAHNHLESLAPLEAAGSEVWFCPHTPRNSNLSKSLGSRSNMPYVFLELKTHEELLDEIAAAQSQFTAASNTKNCLSSFGYMII